MVEKKRWFVVVDNTHTQPLTHARTPTHIERQQHLVARALMRASIVEKFKFHSKCRASVCNFRRVRIELSRRCSNNQTIDITGSLALQSED